MRLPGTLFVSVLTAAALSCVPAIPLHAQADSETLGVPVEDLLTQIQTALAQVQKDLAFEKIPPLKSVTLDLQAAATVQAGPKINLYIFSFGKKWEKDRSQQIQITLTPPSPQTPLRSAKGPSLSQELVALIESAARGVQRARDNKDVPLEASGLTAVFTFVIKGDTSGEAKFQIVPVTVDLSGDLTKTATHKITVVFGDAKKATTSAGNTD